MECYIDVFKTSTLHVSRVMEVLQNLRVSKKYVEHISAHSSDVKYS